MRQILSAEQSVHQARRLSAAARSCGSSSSSCCFLSETKLSSVLAVRGLIATLAPFASVNRNSAPACLWRAAPTAGPAAAVAPFPACSAAVEMDSFMLISAVSPLFDSSGLWQLCQTDSVYPILSGCKEPAVSCGPTRVSRRFTQPLCGRCL